MVSCVLFKMPAGYEDFVRQSEARKRLASALATDKASGSDAMQTQVSSPKPTTEHQEEQTCSGAQRGTSKRRRKKKKPRQAKEGQ